MRALVQRVDWAEVEVEGRLAGQIRQGMLVYVGVRATDTEADARELARKIGNLRIFPDAQDKLNLSLRDARGGVLVVSNFTLLGDARKGRRPDFVGAAPAGQARPLHEKFIAALKDLGLEVATGVFGAHMIVRSAAWGPVNLLLDVPPDQLATPDQPDPSSHQEQP